MDNKNKRKTSKQNPKQDANTNTEVLNTEEEKVSHDKTVQENKKGDTDDKKAVKQQKNEKTDAKKTAAPQKKEETSSKSEAESDDAKSIEPKKENDSKDNNKKNQVSIKKEDSSNRTANGDLSSEQMKGNAMNAAKILLPVAACAIIIAVIISYMGSQKKVDTVVLNDEDQTSEAGVTTLSDEPLAQNAYTNVNELMQAFCTAMADGDMDIVKAIKDYNTDKEIITYKEKSEFIERYDNINCYTKPGVEENSYFVYVTYDVKFKDIETKAPGLNAFYVYTSEDGSLKIDGDTEESIKAAFKLVTSQDDVVDLYNKINVSYNEATTSDETLSQFMEELPATIKTSVGTALAQLESGETPQTETDPNETQSTDTASEVEELPQNQVVNQIVRTTDTVNVRSSDSEEADKIGKAQAGTELQRVEERVNGWSKVIFEDREAYIKSDYLEIVTTGEVGSTPETAGTITATTNVNVRSEASQEAEKIGSAQAGVSYNLLEDQGEWYKIDYNGTTGFVKAEFFIR